MVPKKRLPDVIIRRIKQFERATRAQERGAELSSRERAELDSALKKARTDLTAAIESLLPARSMVPRAVQETL